MSLTRGAELLRLPTQGSVPPWGDPVVLQLRMP